MEVLPPGPGYYSLTRHADVLEASKHPQLFCSGRGTNIGDMPPDFLEFLGSMINMDDPKHARLRRIVSRGFTPRQLDQMKGDVEATAAGIVDDVIERGEGDFVTDIAATLPLRIIVDMMGIPRSQEKFIFDRTNVILGLGDPEYVPDQTEGGVMTALLTAAQDLSLLITELAEARVKDPKDDVTTRARHRRGRRRDADARPSWRRSSSCSWWPATRPPATPSPTASSPSPSTPSERDRWAADFDALAPTAVEEIVRWATPVIHFRRTVTQDGARIGDQTFNEGDKVVLWYCLGQPRRRGVRRPVPLRPRPHAERPPRLRRPGPALLPRRPPGPARDHGDVQGAVQADARHPVGRRAGAPPVELHQRDQAPPRRVDPRARELTRAQ